MQTTRYAIELEPGKYAVDYLCDSDTFGISNACLMVETKAQKELPCFKQYHPHARIVKVKCEVQDA